MGLDATVMCNCFREGRTTEPPVPREWLVLDDGYLSLRPERQSNDLDMKVYEWEQRCCPHRGMEHVSERIANWSGYRLFQEALATVGWEHFPVLRAELPNANGGQMSPRAASDALQELASFRRLDAIGSNAFLVNTATGEDIFQHIACYEGVFILSGKDGVDVGVGQFEFFIRRRAEGIDLFRASRFLQEIKNLNQRTRDDEPLQVEYVNQDTGERFQCHTAVSGKAIPWPDGRMQNDEGRYRFDCPRQLHVEIRTVLPDDFSYILEPLETVFRAAVETGNPVRWC